MPPKEDNAQNEPPKNSRNRSNQKKQNQRQGQDAAKNGTRSSGISRGAAVRAQKRSQMDAQKFVNGYAWASSLQPQAGEQPRRANVVTDNFEKLKITFLGGQEAIGEKNMQVVE